MTSLDASLPQTIAYATPQLPAPHSRAGVASIVCAGLAGMAALSAYLAPHYFQGSNSGWDEFIWIILAVMATIGCTLVGLICGIAGTVQRRRRRTCALVGLCLNGLIFTSFAGFFVA